MTINQACISLKGVRCFAHIGFLEAERIAGNLFVVDLDAFCPAIQSMTQDNCVDTPNYAQLYSLIQDEMAQPNRSLEHTAYQLLQRIKKGFPMVTGARLSITKKTPPIQQFDAEGATFTVVVTF